MDSASIALTPGSYQFEWVWFERSGGAEGEFSASKDGGSFHLLGDTTTGGLGVSQVPEPATLVLSGFGLFGMLSLRRRRA